MSDNDNHGAYHRACNRMAKADAATKTIHLVSSSGYVLHIRPNMNRVAILVYPSNIHGFYFYWTTTGGAITNSGAVQSGGPPLSVNIRDHGNLPTLGLYLAADSADTDVTIAEMICPEEQY